MILVSIYRLPQFPVKQLLFELDQVMCKVNTSSHLLLTGDFNIDLFARSPEGHFYKLFFR